MTGRSCGWSLINFSGGAEAHLLRRDKKTGSIPIAGCPGTYIDPSFIDRIVLADGTVLLPEKGRKRQTVLRADALMQVRTMLRNVVTEGTGKAAEVPGVDGGKTRHH